MYLVALKFDRGWDWRKTRACLAQDGPSILLNTLVVTPSEQNMVLDREHEKVIFHPPYPPHTLAAVCQGVKDVSVHREAGSYRRWLATNRTGQGQVVVGVCIVGRTASTTRGRFQSGRAWMWPHRDLGVARVCSILDRTSYTFTVTSTDDAQQKTVRCGRG